MLETTIQSAREDARRQLTICNSCRYCEGFCAVFPAMERRRSFTDGDLDYLANLCHNCRGCYYACQYAPPHTFQVNLPVALSELRNETYEEYAWPKPLAGLFQRNGLVVSLLTAIALAVVLILAALLQDAEVMTAVHTEPGAFFAVISHNVMVGTAGASFGFSILALFLGYRRFRQGTDSSASISKKPLLVAIHDALTLKNLGGGGDGCNYPNMAFSQERRILHHFMFYGFLLCFAATSVGTIYHYVFGWEAPYGYFSLPVILGTVGGIGLLIGPAGLLALKFKADQKPTAQQLMGMDVAFLVLLFLVSLTGLVLLALRETSAMGWLLAIHLGFVLAFFVALPYSKFVHGVYRFAALWQNAREAERV